MKLLATSVVRTRTGGEASEADGRLVVETVATALGGGERLDATVRNDSSEAVRLDRVVLELDARPAEVLEHGWQSWSTVRRAAVDDVRPERAAAPGWFRRSMFADEDAPGRVLSGDGFLVCDLGVVGFLSGRRQLTTVRAAPGANLFATVLCDGLELAPGEELALEPLWASTAEPGAAYGEYADLVAAEATATGAPARADTPAPTGWCSWYQYFHKLRPADIRANLALAAEFDLELVQIDDGWQRSIGEWTETAEHWGEPISRLAGEIAAAGCRPGIWTAPFLVAEAGAVAAAHPDWLVRDPLGRALRAQPNPAWGGWTSALDTTQPEVLEHLRATFATLRAAGFTYFKIDFCFAAALPGRRHLQGRATRAEALRAGLEAVRAGIGDDAFLVGCGCPLGPALGVVDAMRVSEDVAPHWDPVTYFDGFPESTVAARNAIEASVLRVPMHRRWWINDPDCLLLRPSDTLLSDDEREALTMAILGAGAFLVLSDDLRLYGEAEWEVVRQFGRWRDDADRPRKLRDPFATPVMVQGVPDLWIDWDARRATIGIPEAGPEPGSAVGP